MPDLMPTNICFDVTGRDRAYITLSARGCLAVMDWPTGGQQLAFET